MRASVVQVASALVAQQVVQAAAGLVFRAAEAWALEVSAPKAVRWPLD